MRWFVSRLKPNRSKYSNLGHGILQPKAKIPVDHGEYDKVEPFQTTPIRTVPKEILKPCYYKSEKNDLPNHSSVELKTEDDILKMRDSCEISSTILKGIGNMIKVGITTDDIDKFVHEECIKYKAYPSPLHYKGFPKSCCTSVNNIVCHGIPDLRRLVSGDIVTVDITVFYCGFHGDCAKTFVVDDAVLDKQGRDLLRALDCCLKKAIESCGNGQLLRNIGMNIDQYSQLYNCTVIPAVTGHGIGSYFHGPPEILHFRNRRKERMLKGMTFTIEPALTIGQEHVEILEDGWTVTTCDYARCGQLEHTVLITDQGYEVLTN